MKVVLDYDAVMPTKAHETDAGFDLYSREDKEIPPCEYGKEISADSDFPQSFCHVGSATFDTGVHIQLPKGTCGLLVSKSGLNVKYDVTSTGLIDEGYTGSIVVKLYNHSDKPMYIHKGEKITQLVVLPVVKEDIQIAYSLDETDRGDNGFGSSGK